MCAALDQKTLRKAAPLIRAELRELALSGAQSASAALKHVFSQLFGDECSREDEIRFMVYAAPIARRIAISLANADDTVGDGDLRVSDVQEWLGRLDMSDPLRARMIDLHYFAGLSTQETAVALKLPPRAVVRDLHLATAWLRTRL